MIAFALVGIWLLSHIVCIYILRRRNVKVGFALELLGIFLGPFAIPSAFAAGRKPDCSRVSR